MEVKTIFFCNTLRSFSGADCSTATKIKSCPDNCSGNGVCNTQSGVCQCAVYFWLIIYLYLLAVCLRSKLPVHNL